METPMSEPTPDEVLNATPAPGRMILRPIHADMLDDEPLTMADFTQPKRKPRPKKLFPRIGHPDGPIHKSGDMILKPGYMKKVRAFQLDDVVVFSPQGKFKAEWLEPGTKGIIDSQYYGVRFPDAPKVVYLAAKHLRKYYPPRGQWRRGNKPPKVGGG